MPPLGPLSVLLTVFALHRINAQGGGGGGEGCRQTFAKVAGMVPDVNQALQPLFNSSKGVPITAECYNRCKAMEDCAGFVLVYPKNHCYKYSRSNEVQGLTTDPTASYFAKLCLNVPSNCTGRAWAVEYVPGYELSNLQFNVLSNINDRWECASKCTSWKGEEPCLSADYYSKNKTCTLSSHSRWSDLDSIIPTLQSSNGYIDNLCIKDAGPYCWRDALQGQTSERTDQVIYGVEPKECRERCESQVYFTCHAYTHFKATTIAKSQCHLHSDLALLNVGPLLEPQLVPAAGAEYFERIPCVNMSVSCNSTTLTVTLIEPRFKGRMYVESHPECSQRGQGQDSTVLNIPTNNSVCGVLSAHSLNSPNNKTQLRTVVVVQHRHLIQTVQDRVVRVNCFLSGSEDGLTVTPPSDTNNYTVQATISVSNPPPETDVTGYGGNATTSTPRGGGATMVILDARTKMPVRGIIDLGQPLQLKITIDPPYNVSSVRVGHLVASSENNATSKLLLDQEGCPKDLPVFPGLTPEGDNVLVANFKAFKFPDTPVLKLTVTVTFCPGVCPEPKDCGNGVISWGKRRRREASPSLRYEEMPLQVELLVRGSSTTPTAQTSYIINPTEIIPAGFNPDVEVKSEVGDVCMSFLAFSMLALFWLLVQCIIMAICCWYIGRREKEHADTISLRRDFQPQQTQPSIPHVTWADQSPSPIRFRLSTPEA